LNAVVFAFILIGSYALENSLFTVGVTIFFGAVGYFLKKLKVPAAPTVLGIVLGYLTESNLRQALIIADGSFFGVIAKPITAVILIFAVLLSFGTPITEIIKRRIAKKPIVQ
ncbi:MAG: tripartite tricarboxylate transporter permease, partial [Sedimentibacter sp.]